MGFLPVGMSEELAVKQIIFSTTNSIRRKKSTNIAVGA
jgi:hypothetical protein